VLADGVVVGRIMKAAAVPVGMSWNLVPTALSRIAAASS
jgi:hypothetical protein